MNGHGHDFGHEFVPESVSEAENFLTSDSDSDTDSDMGSDKVVTSDTGMFANLGHGRVRKGSNGN